MIGCLSMIMIDQTVVSVALPTMQRDLSLTTASLHWVVNAYLLLLAVLVASSPWSSSPSARWSAACSPRA